MRHLKPPQHETSLIMDAFPVCAIILMEDIAPTKLLLLELQYDFFPHDPTSHTIYVSAVSYNSMFLGEFMIPDWDMFHSLHPTAAYYGAARAIGRCPVYVKILEKLVLPDGSVLRTQLLVKPTRDCLFVDPTRDGKSLLKIWNMNKCTGVVGVFNCQGAGWCKVKKKIVIHDASLGPLTSSVTANDADGIAQFAGSTWNSETIVYAQKAGKVILLPKGAAVPVTLNVVEHELFHICPIKEIKNLVSPICRTVCGHLDTIISSLSFSYSEGERL